MERAEQSGGLILDLDFIRGLIHIPNSKTKAGKRYVPMTVRVREKLLEWIGPRKTGWVLRSPVIQGVRFNGRLSSPLGAEPATRPAFQAT